MSVCVDHPFLPEKIIMFEFVFVKGRVLLDFGLVLILPHKYCFDMTFLWWQRYVAEQSGEDLLLQGFHGKNTNPYRCLNLFDGIFNLDIQILKKVFLQWCEREIFFLIIVHHFREKSSCSVLWELQKLFFTISFSNLKTCHQYLRNLCRMYILSLLIDLGKFAQILGRWNHWQYFQMYQEFF